MRSSVYTHNPLRGGLAANTRHANDFIIGGGGTTSNQYMQQQKNNGAAGAGASSSANNNNNTNILYSSSNLPLRLKLRLAIHVVIFSVRLRRIARFAVRLSRHETFMVKDVYHKLIRSGKIIAGAHGSEDNDNNENENNTNNKKSSGGQNNGHNGGAKAGGYFLLQGKPRPASTASPTSAGDIANPNDPSVLILKLSEALGIAEVTLNDARTAIIRLLGHNQSSKAAASYALLKAFHPTAANSNNHHHVQINAPPTTATAKKHGGGGQVGGSSGGGGGGGGENRQRNASVHPATTMMNAEAIQNVRSALHHRQSIIGGGGTLTTNSSFAPSTSAGGGATAAAMSQQQQEYLQNVGSLLKPGEIISEDIAVRAIRLLKQLSMVRIEQEEEAAENSVAGGGGGAANGGGTTIFNNTRRLEMANIRLGLTPSGAPLNGGGGGGGSNNNGGNSATSALLQNPLLLMSGGAAGRTASSLVGRTTSSAASPNAAASGVGAAAAASSSSACTFNTSTTTAEIRQHQLLKKRLGEQSHANQQMNALFEMLVVNSRQCTSIEELEGNNTNSTAPATEVNTTPSSSSGPFGAGSRHSSRPGTAAAAGGGPPTAAATPAPQPQPLSVRPQIPVLEDVSLIVATTTNANNDNTPSSTTNTNKHMASLALVQHLLDTFGLQVDAVGWALRTIPIPILFPFGNYVSQRSKTLRERWCLYQLAISGNSAGARAAVAAAAQQRKNSSGSGAQQQQRRSTIGSGNSGGSAASAAPTTTSILDPNDLDNEGGYGGLAGCGYFGLASSDWLTSAMVAAIPSDFKKAQMMGTRYADIVVGGNLSGIYPKGGGGSAGEGSVVNNISHHGRRPPSSYSAAGSGGFASDSEEGSVRSPRSDGHGDNGIIMMSAEHSPLSSPHHHHNNGHLSPVNDLSATRRPSFAAGASADGTDSAAHLLPPPRSSSSTAAAAHPTNYFSTRALGPFSDKTRQILKTLTLDDAFITAAHFRQILDLVPSNSTPSLTTAAKDAMLRQISSEAVTSVEKQQQAQLLHKLREQQQILMMRQQQKKNGGSNNRGNSLLGSSSSPSRGGGARVGSVSPMKKKSIAGAGSSGGLNTSSAASTPIADVLPNYTTIASLQQQQQWILHQQAKAQQAAEAVPYHLRKLAFEQQEEELLLAKNTNNNNNGFNSTTNGGDGESNNNGGPLSSQQGTAAAGRDPDEAETAVNEQIQLHRLLRRGSNASSGFHANSPNSAANRKSSGLLGGGGGTDKKNGNKKKNDTSAVVIDADDEASLLQNTSAIPSSSSAADDSFHFRSKHSNNNSRKILNLSRNFNDPRLTSLGQRAQQAVETLENTLDEKIRYGTSAAAAAAAVAAANNGVGGGDNINNEIDHTRQIISNQRRQLRHDQALHSKEKGYSPAISGRSIFKLNDHGAFGLDPRTGKPIITRKDAVFESTLVGRFNGHPGRRRKKNKHNKSNHNHLSKAERRQRRRQQMMADGTYTGGTTDDEDDDDEDSATSSDEEYDQFGRKIVDPHRHVESVVAQYIAQPMSPHRTNANRTLNRPPTANTSSSQLTFSGDHFVRCNDVVIPTTGGVAHKEQIRAQSACNRSRPTLSMLVGGGGGGHHSRASSSMGMGGGMPPRPNSAAASMMMNVNPHYSEVMMSSHQQEPPPLQPQPFMRPNTANGSVVSAGGHRKGDTYLTGKGGPHNNSMGRSIHNSYNSSSSVGNNYGYYNEHNFTSVNCSNPVKDIFDNRPQSGVARRLRRQIPTPTIDNLAGTPSFVLPPQQRARLLYTMTSPAMMNGGGRDAQTGEMIAPEDTPMNRETVTIAGAVLGALQNNKYFSTRNAPLL